MRPGTVSHASLAPDVPHSAQRYIWLNTGRDNEFRSLPNCPFRGAAPRIQSLMWLNHRRPIRAPWHALAAYLNETGDTEHRWLLPGKSWAGRLGLRDALPGALS